MRIPLQEMIFEFVRSSGPGGQNVNKLATKAQLRWHIGHSHTFTDEQKTSIRQALKNKINTADEVVIASDETRSQLTNKQHAVEKLQNLVQKALEIKKKRRPTKPTYASKQKRLAGKKRNAEIKRGRKNGRLE